METPAILLLNILTLISLLVLLVTVYQFKQIQFIIIMVYHSLLTTQNCMSLVG